MKQTVDIFLCDGTAGHACGKRLTSDADGVVIRGSVRAPATGATLIERPVAHPSVKRPPAGVASMERTGGKFAPVEIALCWACFDKAAGRIR